LYVKRFKRPEERRNNTNYPVGLNRVVIIPLTGVFFVRRTCKKLAGNNRDTKYRNSLPQYLSTDSNNNYSGGVRPTAVIMINVSRPTCMRANGTKALTWDGSSGVFSPFIRVSRLPEQYRKTSTREFAIKCFNRSIVRPYTFLTIILVRFVRSNRYLHVIRSTASESSE